MRQGQQHRRGRGRHNNNNNNNNNNRKGQNPLTRSFESNGPDVKVRGTPAHIAEKYISLARDAQSSGDPVLAENYLQHAEHYNRIILAFREQQMQQGGGDMNGHGQQRVRSPMDPVDGDDFAEDEAGADDFGQSEQPTVTRFPHEMQHGGQAGEMQRHGEGRPGGEHQQHRQHRHPDQHNRFRDRYEPRGDRSERQDQRQFDRPERSGERHDRGERFDRFGDRQQRFAERRERHQSERFGDQPAAAAPSQPERSIEPREAPPVVQRPPEEAPAPEAAAPRAEGGAPRRRERFAGAHEQPEFLRRPVRRTRRDSEAAPPADGPAVADEPPRE